MFIYYILINITIITNNFTIKNINKFNNNNFITTK